MRKAIADGGTWGAGSALVAVVAVVVGLVRFHGNEFVSTDDYLMFPTWTIAFYCVIPLLIGLVVFFFAWNNALDREEKLKNKQKRPAATHQDEQDRRPTKD